MLNNYINQLGSRYALKIKEVKKLVTFVGEVFDELIYSCLHPSKVKWKSVLYYMEMCGRNATGIVIVICFLMGLILRFQAALQFKQ